MRIGARLRTVGFLAYRFPSSARRFVAAFCMIFRSAANISNDQASDFVGTYRFGATESATAPEPLPAVWQSIARECRMNLSLRSNELLTEPLLELIPELGQLS